MRWYAICLVFLAACAHRTLPLNVPAWDRDSAVDSFIQGTGAFRVGDYDRAVAFYRRAFIYYPRAEIAFDLALAEYKRGNPYAALVWLKTFWRTNRGISPGTMAARLAARVVRIIDAYEEAVQQQNLEELPPMSSGEASEYGWSGGF